MLVSATVFFLCAFGFFISRLPKSLLRHYFASFRVRHGLGVQVGLTVLVTVITSMLVATALRPGHPLMEAVNAAAFGALATAALLDLLLFRLKIRR